MYTHPRQIPVTRCRRAFTLVDLTITVLIIGIMSAVATPKFVDAMIYRRADAAANRVAADLNLARRTAVSSGKPQVVNFTLVTSVYAMPGVTDIDHPGQTYSVDLTSTRYAVTLSSINFGASGTATSITFDMYGRPDYGGSVTIQTGTQTRVVNVDADTGRATVL